MDDSFDIYGDLLTSTQQGVPEDSKCHKELAVKTEILEKELNFLRKQLEDLESVNKKLKWNFSSLIKTAKSEISRKDNVITDLRTKLDNVTFRRNPRHKPYARKQEPPISNGIPHEQDHQDTVDHPLNNPPSLLTLKLPSVNEFVDSNVADDHPGTEIVKQEHISILDDPGNVSEECDEVTTDKLEYKKTLYGERLHKKIMEIEESEKRKKAEENVKKKEEELRLKYISSDTVNNKENLSNHLDRESTHQTTSNKIPDDIKSNLVIEKSEIIKMEESPHVETNFIKNEENSWPKPDKHFSAKTNSSVSSNNQWYSHNSKHESRNSPVNQEYRNRYHDDRKDNYERHRYNTSRYKESFSKHNRRDRDNNSRYDYHKNSNHYNSRFKEEVRGRYVTRDDTIRSYEKERRKRENIETLKRMRRSVSEDRILHDSKRRRIEHEDLIHSCNSRREFIEMSDSSYLKSRNNSEENERKKKKHDLQKLISDQSWMKETVKPHMLLRNSQTHVSGESPRRLDFNKIINNDKEIKELPSNKLGGSEKCDNKKENSREKDAKPSKCNEKKLSENIDTLHTASSIERVKKEKVDNAYNDMTSRLKKSKDDNLDNKLNEIMKNEKSSKRKETSREKDANTSKCNERIVSDRVDTLQLTSNIKKVKKEELENDNNEMTSKLEPPRENDSLDNKINGIMTNEKSSKRKESSRENDAKTNECKERKVSESIDTLQPASSIKKVEKEKLTNSNNNMTSKFEQPNENNELNGIMKHEKSYKRKESSREKDAKISKCDERKPSENIDTLQPASSIKKVKKEELENDNTKITSKLEPRENDIVNNEMNIKMKNEKSSKRKESLRENDPKTTKCNERKASLNIDTLQSASSTKKLEKEEVKDANNDMTCKFEQPNKNNDSNNELNEIMKNEKSSKRKDSSREKDAKTSKCDERKPSENLDTLQPASSTKRVEKEELKNDNNDMTSKFKQLNKNNNLNYESNGFIKHDKASKQKESSRGKEAKTSKCNERKISDNIDTLQPASSIERVKKEKVDNTYNDVTSKIEQLNENNNLNNELNGIMKHEKSSKQKESSREKDAKTSKCNERKVSEKIVTAQPASSTKKVEKDEFKNVNNDMTRKFEQPNVNDCLDNKLNGIIKHEKSSKQKESSCEKNENIQDCNNVDILRTEKTEKRANFEDVSAIIEPVVKDKPLEKNVSSNERCNKVIEATEKRILEKMSKPTTKETRIANEQISSRNNKVVNNVEHIHQNSVSNDYNENVKSLVEKEISSDRDKKTKDRRKETTGNDDSYGFRKTKDPVKSRNSNKVIENEKSLRETDIKTEDHRGRKISNRINDHHEKGRTEKTRGKISERKKNQMKSLFSNEISDDEKLKQKRISHHRDKKSERGDKKSNSCFKESNRNFELDNKSKTAKEKVSSEKKEKEYSRKSKERNDNTKVTLSNEFNDVKPTVREETAYKGKYLAEELEDGEIIEDFEIVEDDLLTGKPGNTVDINLIKTSIKTGINAFVSTESQVKTHYPNNNEFENVTEKIIRNENQSVKNITEIDAGIEGSKNEKELSLIKSNLKNESNDKFHVIHEKLEEKTSKESASNTKFEKQRSNVDESSLIPKAPEESSKGTCLIEHNKEETFNQKQELYTQKSQVIENTVKNMHSELNLENMNGIFQNEKADETTHGQKSILETLLQMKETNTSKKKTNVSKLKEIKNIIVVKRRRITRTENKLTSNSPELMEIDSRVKKCNNPDLGSANKVESNVVCSKTEEDKNNKMPANVIAEKLEKQIKFSANIEIGKDVPGSREEINKEANIEIGEKNENVCDPNKLLKNTVVESSTISTEVKVSKVNLKKQSVSISKPNTINNIILVKRRRRPVQLADSPSVKIQPQSLN